MTDRWSEHRANVAAIKASGGGSIAATDPDRSRWHEPTPSAPTGPLPDCRHRGVALVKPCCVLHECREGLGGLVGPDGLMTFASLGDCLRCDHAGRIAT